MTHFYWFGYIEGLRGPEPQIWLDSIPQHGRVIWKMRIASNADGKNLDGFALAYPCPEHGA